MAEVYTSFLPVDGDSTETRMRKLHLGIMSMGEDLYSFNAAISEMRKKIDDYDKVHQRLQAEYKALKEEERRDG